MVRRWSCIIELNNNFSKISNFSKAHKINLFKSSVNFKRFTFKITKFKRKSLVRFKHRSNWLIYTNALKLWVKDFLFNKNYLRYQFLNRIFSNTFIFYNFNFTKNRSETFFYNFNFLFNTFSRKSYLYFYKNSFSYVKNSSITFGFSLNQPLFNNSTLPVYSQHESTLLPYSFSKSYDFDFSSIFNSLFEITLKKNLEFRKILTYLFVIKIFK